MVRDMALTYTNSSRDLRVADVRILVKYTANTSIIVSELDLAS